MKVGDLVEFNDDKCFNGAVQTDWFYDDLKLKSVAMSYVFHGPKYFGISKSDINSEGNNLIDTASYTLKLTDKVYDEKPDNEFVMTIAGYGCGKSHLAVCLAALFSGNPTMSQIVIENIANADSTIAEEIRKRQTRKNLVIALNGMNNFNLDAEVLRCVRLSLSQNGLSDDVLKKLTKSYDIAKHFVNSVFDIFESRFKQLTFENKRVDLSGSELKQYILKNLESDPEVLEIVNAVYKEINGDSIQWDRGLSAGEILSTLSEELCGADKYFNKIVFLFDEFGRYIEYAAANPTIAGEAALQQIFEAVQNADGKIIFVSFVQNELDAYLSRIEKTSNIIRYVGRYECSQEFYLSSNFETILANLLQKKNPEKYHYIFEDTFQQHEKYYKSIENAIERWNRSSLKKSVWTMPTLYKSVIFEGCYPIHPISVWLLSNMGNWMQQRSAIAFVSEMMNRIADKEIEGSQLPYIYPIDLIDSGIYEEMLSSEEKGLVSSQYCMLYRDIIVKIGDKLSEVELKVLKAALIVNIGRFSFYNEEDAITALKYCSALKEEDIKKALISLENTYGVLSYDENNHTFDLLAEANGLNEFKRVYARYRIGVSSASIDYCDETLLKEILMDVDIDTSFAQEHHVSSYEWRFRKVLMDCSQISKDFLTFEIKELESSYEGIEARGELIFAYCSQDSQKEISRLATLCKQTELNHHAIIIIFLDDAEKEIVSSLTVNYVLDKFSKADNERFQKQISAQRKAQTKKITRTFNSLVQQRMMISDEGVVQFEGRLNTICSQRFEELYPDIPPFMFDGFEKKNPTTAKKYLTNICSRLFDRTLMNVQNYNALLPDEKNRIKSSILIGTSTSWEVYSDSCVLGEPLNSKISKVYKGIKKMLECDDQMNFYQLMMPFVKMPYGMNINSFVLFLFYFIAFQDKQILCYYGNEKLQSNQISNFIFKGSKLQNKELFKIKLQRNLYYDKNLVQDLCKEILDCTNVEECGQYSSKLEATILQEGIDEADQLIVANARARLDDGKNLYNFIYSNLEKGKDIVREGNKKFVIQKFVKVFSYIIEPGGIIKEGLPFVYSENYKKQMDDLKNDVNRILDKKFIDAVNVFTCNITQLSQFKSICNNVGNILKSNGYLEYAQAIEERAIDVEEELQAKQKYDRVLVEFDQDMAMLGEVGNYSYETCMSVERELDGWSNFFTEKTDIPIGILGNRIEEISKTKQKISNQVTNLHSEVQNICIKAFQINSIEELNELSRRIKKALDRGVSEKDSITLEELLGQGEEALKIIATLPDSINELEEIINSLSSEDGAFKTLIIKEAFTKMNAIREQQNQWIEKYLIPVEQDITSMTAVDCVNWKTHTEKSPIYIDEKIMKRYKEDLLIVDKQLHKSRVEGVYVMFNDLTDDEKAEFFNMIKDR